MSIDWSTTVPGPVSVVTNNPSPPNRAVVTPPATAISKLTVASNPTTRPVCTLTTSPLFSFHLDDVPAALEKYHALPAHALEDETLAPEQPGPNLFGEGNIELDSLFAGQEGIFLRDEDIPRRYE